MSEVVDTAVAEAPGVRAALPTSRKSQRIPIAIMVLLIVVAPFFVYPVFLMKALCFALFACAFNMLLGYSGLLSFGHALFFGGAAYATAYAAQTWGWHPETAILLGMATALVLGTIVGLLAIRRQGIYFAMITLALAQMFYFFCVRAPFTGGEDGLQGVPRGKLFGVISLQNTWAMYSFVAVIFLIGFAILFRAVHSPFGQVLKAIRENEPRAISLGYDADRYKLIAFILSATLAGLAGSTKCLVFELASLTDVNWNMSGDIILMTLIGGVGTTFGPIFGAVFLVTLENYLAQLGSWVTVVEGSIFIVCVLAFRRGLFGELSRWLKREL
jgi:branched-chain amino acid transport system permease protein